MAIRQVQAPDGRVLEVDVPEGASTDQILQTAAQQYYSDVANLPPKYTLGETVGKAFSRGTKRLGSTFGDVIPAMIGSGLGFEDYAKRQMEEARASEGYIQRSLAPQFPSFKDVAGLGDAGKFVAETIFEQIPNFGTMFLSGGAGSQAAKIGAQQFAKKYTGKKFAEEMAKRQVRGMTAGTALGSYALNAPEIFQNIYDQTGELATGTALLFGAGAAALDSALPTSILKSLTPYEKLAVSKQILKKSGADSRLVNKVFKGLGKGAITEGLTEGAQEAISISAEKFVANNPQIFDSEDFDRIMESSVRGMIAGGGISAIAAPFEQTQAPAVPRTETPVTPVTPVTPETVPPSDIEGELPPVTPVAPVTPVTPTEPQGATQLPLPGIPEELPGPVQTEVEPPVKKGKGKAPVQEELPFPYLPKPKGKQPPPEEVEIIANLNPEDTEKAKEQLALNQGLEYDSTKDSAYNPRTKEHYEWDRNTLKWQVNKDDAQITKSGTDTTLGINTPISSGPNATATSEIAESERGGMGDASSIVADSRRREAASDYTLEDGSSVKESSANQQDYEELYAQPGQSYNNLFNNAQEFKDELYGEFGKEKIDRLLERGRLRVVDSAADLNHAVSPGTLGFYQWNSRSDRFRTGVTTMIANRNPKGTARDILLHEIGEHYGLEGMLGNNYMPTLIQLNKLKDTDPIVKSAWDQVTRVYTAGDPVRYRPGSKDFLREVAAHVGETAPENTWFRRLMGAAKNLLRRLGLYDPNKITGRDLQDMILYSLNRALNERVPTVRLQTDEEVETLYKTLFSTKEPFGGYNPNVAKKALNLAGAAYTSIQKGSPKVLDDIKNKLSELPFNLRSAYIGLLGLPAIQQLYGKYLPSLKKLISQLEKRAAAADTQRAIVSDLGGGIGMDIIKGRKRQNIIFVDKKTNKEIPMEKLYDGTYSVKDTTWEMRKVQGSETTEQYSPSLLKKWQSIVYDLSRGDDGIYELGINPTNPEHAEHPLVRQFKQLPKELQLLSIAYSNYFNQQAQRFNEAIIKLLPEKDSKGKPIPYSEKAKKFKEQLIENQLEFYHPFRREGEHVLQYQPAGLTREGFAQEVYVERFKTQRELNRRVEEVISTGGRFISASIQPETARIKEMPPSDFFHQVINEVRDQLADAKGNLSPRSQELVDSIYGFYIDMFPSSAIRQATRRRKGTRGEIQDIVGGFIDVGARMANQISNMEYIPQFNETLSDIKEEAKIAQETTILQDPTLEPSKKDALQATIAYVADDISQKGRNFMNNPVADRFSGELAYVSFLTTIAGNVSSAAVNLTQMFIIVLPGLIAKHGVVNAGKALNEAFRIYRSGGKDNNRVRFRDWSFGMKDGHLRSQENANKGLIKQEDVLSQDLLDLYEYGVANSVFKRGLGYELTEMRKSRAEDYTGMGATVNAFLGWMFQNTERLNREVTYLASYIAEKESGKSTQEATEIAQDFTRESHGTSLPEVGPRYFQTGWGKTIFTFKRYAHQMMALIIKLFHDSFKGAELRRSELAQLISETSDPNQIAQYEKEIEDLKQVKSAARRQLAGIYGMSFMFAGIQGMPLYGAAEAMTEALYAMFGDDDEPFDFNEGTRSIFGDIGYKGPVNKLLNLDIASRTGFSNLIWRDDPRRVQEIGVLGYIGESLLGPSWAYLRNVGRGVEDMTNGQWYRGIEQTLPAFLRNPMKAVRYLDEGARTRNGAQLTDLNGFDAFMQIFGFTNEDLAKVYEQNNAMKNAERKMLQRRSGLLTAAFLARDTNDRELYSEVLKEISKYNQSETGKLNPINGKTLSMSYKQRKRAIEESVNGITLTKKYRDFLQKEFAG